MRILTLTLHLQPEEAYTLVECIDQLREGLMQHYADDIAAMLQQAAARDIADDPLR
jgi:hypothetical protein